MRSQARPPAWTRWQGSVWIAALTAAVFVVQGYHPFTEDGGLYAIGAEWLLDRRLFPQSTHFVSDHLLWSAFGWMIAGVARVLHAPLEWVLLGAYLATAALTLFAARAVLRRCGCSDVEQLGGMALLALWWTMPVAGTSLMLMDPYVTARSVSTPLTLLAMAWAMDDWHAAPRSAILCAAALVVAAVFHPLMATYALGLIVMMRLARWRHRALACAAFGAAAVIAAGLLQWIARPDSPALSEAACSRYYWFLSQWQWYELVGLAGPLVVLGGLMLWRRARWNEQTNQLIGSLAVLCALGFTCALLYAHEDYRSHLVARLQPLRVYLPVYAVLPMLLGAAAVRAVRFSRSPRRARLGLALFLAFFCASALGMFAGQRSIYPASAHWETPSHQPDVNLWVQAFVWARQNTPRDALFALDARYISAPGEDAHLFRAIAERNMLPDYSKDGGEAAAMRPQLAAEWQRGVQVQTGLSGLTDAQRDARLRPFEVTWMVLRARSVTAHPCPFQNAAVKICRLN